MRTFVWMIGLAFVSGAMSFLVDLGRSLLKQRRGARR